MPKSIQLKITPLSIQEFMRKYNVGSTEYIKYLEANTATHHYQGKTLEQWLQAQLGSLNND